MKKPRKLTPEQLAVKRECNRRWRLANPEKAKASIEKWKQANPEKALDLGRSRSRHYYHRNKETCNARSNEYLRNKRKDEPDKMNEASRIRNKKWRGENPEKSRIQSREKQARWKLENPEKWRKQCSERQRRVTERVTDSYISMLLRLPVEILRELLPNLLDAKRQEILLKRQLKPKTNQ